MDEIKSSINDLNDVNGLDRVLTLLTQASASVKSAMKPVEVQQVQFERKDQFNTTQKNETQLRFTKTTANPGRRDRTFL